MMHPTIERVLAVLLGVRPQAHGDGCPLCRDRRRANVEAAWERVWPWLLVVAFIALLCTGSALAAVLPS